MNKYTHLSSLVFNQPLLITDQYAETLAAILGDRIGFNIEGLEIQSDPKDKRENKLLGRGTYVIPVVGSMTHRATGIEALSGMTSYSTLKNQLSEAFDNPDITSIILDVDSPGGMVNGAFDLRDYLMEQRGKKPFYAISRDSMYSAAYLLGSTADKVFTTQTGGVGSIGVVAMHLDQSKKNEMEGVKPTFISAGKYKTAGNPHEPLEGEALKEMQASVDDTYSMFVSAVAQARGVDEKMVRQTEARTYRGAKGIKAGLSDGIRSYESLISELSQTAPKTYALNPVKQVGKIAADAVTEGIKMETENKEQIEKLEADLKAAVEAKENLTKLILKEGYSITKEGLTKPVPKEMIEVDGVTIEKASLPDVVVKALEAKTAEETRIKATKTFPNLKESLAVKAYSAFQGDDEMISMLASLNNAVGEMLEESGVQNVDQSIGTAQEQFDALVLKRMKETGENKYAAYASVHATDEGKKLFNEIYKDKE